MANVPFQAFSWRVWVQVGLALCCPYGIGLDCPAWRHSVTDSSQVHKQILGWNGERTSDRYAKASANRWYGELRKQNNATTLLGSSLPPHALHGILFIVLLRVPAILEDCKDHDDKWEHYRHGKIDEQNSVDASLHSYFQCMGAHFFSRLEPYHCISINL